MELIFDYFKEHSTNLTILLFLAIIFGKGVLFGGLSKYDEDWSDKLN